MRSLGEPNEQNSALIIEQVGAFAGMMTWSKSWDVSRIKGVLHNLGKSQSFCLSFLEAFSSIKIIS